MKISEVEEEIDHKWGSNDYEYMEDAEEFVQDLQGKDASQNLAFQADKTKQDAEKMAIAFLATRLEYPSQEIYNSGDVNSSVLYVYAQL